jgi:hypothetical protein
MDGKTAKMGRDKRGYIDGNIALDSIEPLAEGISLSVTHYLFLEYIGLLEVGMFPRSTSTSMSPMR